MHIDAFLLIFGQLFYFEKFQDCFTVGGWGGVNPYGQPDRKKTVFFDDFP